MAHDLIQIQDLIYVKMKKTRIILSKCRRWIKNYIFIIIII